MNCTIAHYSDAGHWVESIKVMVTQCNTNVPEARMQPVDHLVDKESYQLDAFLFLSDPSPIIGYACHSLTH